MTQLSTEWIERLGPAYLPGSGRDAPRAAFEDIKESIPKRVDADVLVTAPALTLARQLYGARYFWETHEVLEALWSACLPNTQARHFLQALIQIANACLKLRMQQPNASLRLVRDGERLMAEARGLDVGLDIDAFLQQCDEFRTAILAGDVGAALMERPAIGWDGQATRAQAGDAGGR